jgi:hypothetical protein
MAGWRCFLDPIGPGSVLGLRPIIDSDQEMGPDQETNPHKENAGGNGPT